MIELDKNGKERALFKDTNTGGALSMSKSGALFIVQRGLYPSIWQLRPQRRLLADKFMGDPLDKVAPKFPNVKFAGTVVRTNKAIDPNPASVR